MVSKGNCLRYVMTHTRYSGWVGRQACQRLLRSSSLAGESTRLLASKLTTSPNEPGEDGNPAWINGSPPKGRRLVCCQTGHITVSCNQHLDFSREGRKISEKMRDAGQVQNVDGARTHLSARPRIVSGDFELSEASSQGG